MKILHLVPGSGGTFYCQNCLRDYSLVRALRRAGHDALMVPLYLPPFGADAETWSVAPVFFGGINVYLRHAVPFFRKVPAWVTRLLDSRWMLKMAAKREGSTNAASLGPMTMSMLQGSGGTQKREFERLRDWIGLHEKPDVIHISNALLLGLAPELRQVSDAPILCSLQDEEPWVEAMAAPYNAQCWEAMAALAQSVDHFVSTSVWYAGRMQERMKLQPQKISVIYPGVELLGSAEREQRDQPPALGYLSRINHAQGFHLLADAFVDLKRDPRLRDLQLRASGGLTSADRPFLARVRAELRKHGFDDALHVLPKFEGPERTAMLNSLSVMSTPVPGGEAFGLQLIEAMAHGVPVVQPREGAYTELVETTGGGLLYDPAEHGALADALKRVLCDKSLAARLGRQGREAVEHAFTVDHAAQKIVALYARVIEEKGR